MPYATKSRAVVELDVFIGTPSSVDTFGLEEIRYTKRDGGVNRPAWGTVEETGPIYVLPGTLTEVPTGTVFERQVVETEDESAPIIGAWTMVGPMSSLEGQYEPVLLGRNRVNAPGAPMRNPLGLVLRAEDRSVILRPAIGEQDLDQWTGEPLVDGSGNPVLVVE
jgi:hypothetical protein